MIIKTYRTSLDTYSKLVTILFYILMLSGSYFVPISKSIDSVAISIFIVVLIILVVLCFFPVKIILSEHEVIIRKLIRSIRIPLKDIESVSEAIIFPIPMTISSQGFLGYLGTTMDGAKSYVTNRKKVVHLTTKDNKKYLFSPDNTPAFLRDIKALIK